MVLMVRGDLPAPWAREDLWVQRAATARPVRTERMVPTVRQDRRGHRVLKVRTVLEALLA